MTTTPTPGGGKTMDPAHEDGSRIAASEDARRAGSAADRAGAGVGATAEADTASATEAVMNAPDVAALLARVEEREGPVFDISLHTSVKWITPDHHVPIYLEDIWAAYVAGAQSGQRHPNASRALLNQSADAYVKSQFMTDLNTGETNRTDILVPALATALRAALADQRRWEPIATAPRDETAVLLLTRSGVVEGRYFKSEILAGGVDGPEEQGAVWSVLDDIAQYEVEEWCDERGALVYGDGQVTHWMPLPALPIDAAITADGGGV